MQIIRFPKPNEWPGVLRRPCNDDVDFELSVASIVRDVRIGGDDAVRRFTRDLDGSDIESFSVDTKALSDAGSKIPDQLKNAILTAKSNIERFHRVQREPTEVIETTPGVTCWRKSIAIERVGLYVPAGSAPLLSTVLMLAVPAKLAGCHEIILCSPPDKNGNIAPEILFTAQLCGVDRVFRVGGAQAIAAMAYGTATVPRVDKIFGPGNSYVTAAKQLVSKDVAIDMPAGPSEVLVFADEQCEPAFVAADLLSQAEHGVDSQVILVSTSETVIQRVLADVEDQLADLPRAGIARVALEASRAILVRDEDDAIDLINAYAPEHLILAVETADEVADRIRNAGSVFLGNLSCESAGDYATGTNHTLPTAGFARSMGGLSLDSFLKKVTFQRLTAEGLRNIGPVIEAMAAAERLDAHKNAVTIRLEALS